MKVVSGSWISLVFYPGREWERTKHDTSFSLDDARERLSYRAFKSQRGLRARQWAEMSTGPCSGRWCASTRVMTIPTTGRGIGDRPDRK